MAGGRRQQGRAVPIVDASGQRWKVTGGLGALMTAAVASVAWYFAPEAARQAVILAALLSGVVGIAAIAMVRCPACGASLGAWAFSTGGLTGWHEALVEAVECPRCGQRPAPR